MKKTLCVVCALWLICGALFAGETSSSAYLEACKAFSRGEWSSAELLLRKAVAYPQNNNADTNYMLITAEIYAGDDNRALVDTEAFLRNYPDSIYTPRIQYMRGKLLYSLGEYEKAIIVLSDFCHQNETSELYPAALFYIAESLYAGFRYDEAETIYERIISQYPDSDKVSASQFRLESIAQRSREEKLLYLLKQTGEEYLAAKEDYEKQLRLYNSEAINTTRERLVDAQQKNQELEEQIRDLENQIAELKAEQEARNDQEQAVIVAAKKEDVFTETSPANEDLKLLKQKARLVQWLIDGEKQNEGK
ncbi:MAG: tetratricopeptide repeat protein [Treponema sp.]|nr:tetratricopeptide repeat protein [Treponema sp.]